ncbi:MAG: mannonate dehydratase [Chloroflexi bacterium]|nr:mannonate dehydratase [Chloroflexota bacterium]
MKIGIRTRHGEEEALTVAEQIGADGASLWASAFEGFRRNYLPGIDEFAAMRERFEKHHLMWTGMGVVCEGFMKNQLLGLPGRDEEIDKLCEIIRRLGEVYQDVPASETPVIIMDQRPTYWAHEGWTGGKRIPGRGGVLLYDFDNDRDAEHRDAPAGHVELDEVWERIFYLYKRIVPVAEEADVRLATHPDDPPLRVYRGAAQALNGIAGFKTLFDLFPNPYNGMLLCLGCMAEAGEDPIEAIRTFGGMGRIFYVHFRNVKGTVPHYTEVFPNMGDTDMVAAIKALWDVGYDRFLVPDHHFGILGETTVGAISRAWQVGYITALIQATRP